MLFWINPVKKGGGSKNNTNKVGEGRTLRPESFNCLPRKSPSLGERLLLLILYCEKTASVNKGKN